jgi:hypothetical protein
MPFIGDPRRPEIDQYAIKFLIGAIAVSLPLIEFALTSGSITSISASFWFEPGVWPRNIFVGFLFAISAFLLAYNGKSETEMWLGKAASLAAAGIAMFPCACGNPSREIIPRVHLISAGVMFFVLTCFCYVFFERAREKRHLHAYVRATIYALCGLGMIVSILLFIFAAFKGGEGLVFLGEAVGLVSFGISWLTASRVLPVITLPSERESLFTVSKSYGSVGPVPGGASAQRVK